MTLNKTDRIVISPHICTTNVMLYVINMSVM